MKKLYGTGVALITPFTETLEVDYKGLKKLLQHTAKGVDYYVVMGTTGEAATCSEEEKKRVLEFVKNNNPNIQSNPFRKIIPKPNWAVTYNGLSRIPGLDKIFTNGSL